MFTEPERAARGLPSVGIAIAGLAVLIAVALWVVLGRRHAAAAGPAGVSPGSMAYAPHLRLTDLQLSESTSFSGGKETFVDGRIANEAAGTVTGATVEVSFAGDGAPQRETVPVTLIRTRQPYIDVQPLSAAPLAPGTSAEFRLTFDDIRPDWNQQVPSIRIVGVVTR